MQSTPKKAALSQLLCNHEAFLQDRLANFVGREAELAQIEQLILAKASTGGYVTITGQAGQGKSSIIARLITKHVADNPAYHFIPFNPNPDHQVTLLRNLMARLILKYDLSDLYVASESRATLSEFFPKVLQEAGAKRAANQLPELIFIDGLDQILEDTNGKRDLNFLPTNPPPGIVFVLGTRPNDTLEPLELRKPHAQYLLPELSRPDFDLLLKQRNVVIKPPLADYLYEAMQRNALYLDLVAKEITQQSQENVAIEELIKRIAANPNDLFTLSFERYQTQPTWETILKPLLGILLVAQQPLSFAALRQILDLENDYQAVGNSLQKLGGLLSTDEKGRYYLYHLKLRDYLKQDPADPNKSYIFTCDEEQALHAKLTEWCEKNELSLIWQPNETSTNQVENERKGYAREHYIKNLYSSKNWTKLWQVLDDGDYGRAKLKYDPSTRSYCADLDLGREAAIQAGDRLAEKIADLPRLWRYSLLRCTLATRANDIPAKLFSMMIKVGREQEALGLIELITYPSKKAQALVIFAHTISQLQPSRQAEADLLYLRALMLLGQLDRYYGDDEALTYLLNMTDWHDRQRVDTLLGWTQQLNGKIDWILGPIALKIAGADDVPQALTILNALENELYKFQACVELVLLINKTNTKSPYIQELLNQARLMIELISDKDVKDRVIGELALVLCDIQSQWQQALEVTKSSVGDDHKSYVLHQIALKMIKTGVSYEHTIEVLSLFGKSYEQPHMRHALAVVLAEVGQIEQALEIAQSIEVGSESGIHYATEIALAMCKTGDNLDKACKFLNQMLEKTFLLENDYSKEANITAIAVSFAKLGGKGIKQALELINSIKNVDSKDWMLAQIIVNMSEIGNYQQGLELVGDIKKPYSKAQALRAIAKAVAKDNLKEAQDLMSQSIKLLYFMKRDEDFRANNLSYTVADMFEIEITPALVNQALEAAYSVDDTSPSHYILTRLAVTMTKAGYYHQALDLALSISDDISRDKDSALEKMTLAVVNADYQQALKFANLIEDAPEKASTLHNLAMSMREFDHSIALEIALQAFEVAKVNQEQSTYSMQWLPVTVYQIARNSQQALQMTDLIKDKNTKADCLAALTVNMYWVDDNRPQVLDIINSIEDDVSKHCYAKSYALRHLIEAIIGTSDNYQYALEIANAIESDMYNAEAMLIIVCYLIKTGLIDKALEIAYAMRDNHYRIGNLSKVAVALGQAGHTDQAHQILMQLLETVPLIEDKQRKSQAPINIAAHLLEVSHIYYQEAVEIVRSNEDNRRKNRVLADFADKRSKLGYAYYQEALATAYSIESTDEQSFALSKIAINMGEAGDYEQALDIAYSIEDSSHCKSTTLGEIAIILIQAGKLEQGLEIAYTLLKTSPDESMILIKLIDCLSKAGDEQSAVTFIQTLWRQVRTKEQLLSFLGAIYPLIRNKVFVGTEFIEAFSWVKGSVGG